jgi:hypothetical protein
MIARRLAAACLAAVAVLSAVAVPAAAPAAGPRSTPPGLVLKFAGNSITVGYGTSAAWRDSYPQRTINRVCGWNCGPTAIVGHPGQCLVYPGCGYGPTLLSTFGPEVLATAPTPTTVLVEIGTNDLAHASDTDMETAYQTLVAQGAAVGARVLVGTIPPYGAGYTWYSWVEAQRERINTWIVTTYGSGGQCGGTSQCVDFAAVLTTGSPGAYYMWAPYDSGDHVHPDDLGAMRMADMLAPGQLQGAP